MGLKHSVLLLGGLLLLGCNVDSSLSVKREGAGEGHVSGTKIDCGEQCQASYGINVYYGGLFGFGATVPLTATPKEGSDFYGWYSPWRDCEPTLPTCNVRLGISILDPYDDALDPDNYQGEDVTMTAIFVPAGSVMESARHQYNNATCYLSSSGEIPCWGYVDGPTMNQPNNLQLASNYACALDGKTLYCWEDEYHHYPPAIPADLQVDAYSVQYAFLCALSTEHQVQCFTRPDQEHAVSAVPNLNHPTELWTNHANACAQTTDGTVCWGTFFLGQSQPPALAAPIALALNQTHSCAIDGVSGVHCWGQALASTDFIADISNPQDIALFAGSNSGVCIHDGSVWHCLNQRLEAMALPPAIQGAAKIKADDRQLCGLGSQGLACNFIASSTPRTLPDTMLAPTDFSLAASALCTLSGRTVECIGNTASYPGERFRNGRVVSQQQPRLMAHNFSQLCVAGDEGVLCYDRYAGIFSPANLKNVTALSMNNNAGCAIANDAVTCWGNNTYGILDVPPLSHPRALQMADYHACALDDSGVVCWGETLTEH